MGHPVVAKYHHEKIILSLTGVRGTIVGWGFTSARNQTFKLLEKVQELNGVSQVPETHQQKVTVIG